MASPGGELPFGIDITKKNDKYDAKILNGDEKFDTSSVSIDNNKLLINFSWFDAKIEAMTSLRLQKY